MADYKETIQLPNPKFAMRANLKDTEPHIQKNWEAKNIYEKIRDRKSTRYTLHDGPPYANGKIHIGHALNKILKDIVVKSKAMTGKAVHFVPGWDCHGLPIELQVEKDKKTGNMNPLERIKGYREYAEKFIELQKVDFKRLGIIGDWDHPYKTMDFKYEAEILRQFGKMVDAGLIYQGKKPVYWCIKTRTALAEAEIEYQDRVDPSIYVTFAVRETSIPKLANAKFVIWTTTPWTLPANLAISVNPEFTYVLTSSGYVVAKDLLEKFNAECSLQETIKEEFKGQLLEGIKTQHPFINRDSIIILGDHVSAESGTGCVHTAPGHGMEDYIVGLKYGLEPFCPVDEAGRLMPEAEVCVGEKIFDANPKIIEILKEKKALLAVHDYPHSYPHNWRTPSPLIFRATNQWFMTMDGKDSIRDKAMKAIQETNWYPKWGEARITGMISSKPDWVLSRQRLWGVPIPGLKCKACEKIELNSTIVENLALKVSEEGIEAWQKYEAKDFFSGKCSGCGGTDFEKDRSILDVWFDSGVSHSAVVTQLKEKLPVDLYLEGSDQHRGWFQSSMITSLALSEHAPYKNVLTHGFVLDGKGNKMSKSLGNVISPEEVVKVNGADVLRLWVSSENFSDDVRISEEILKRSVESYRKIRNTLRFGLGVIEGFEPQKDVELLPVDNYILGIYETFKEKVLKAYETFEFHQIYHLTNNFINVDLSSFYFDIIKDRIYIDHPAWPRRIAAQQTVHEIVTGTIQLLAPILSHTMEEAWGSLSDENSKGSILFESFPTLKESNKNYKYNTLVDELRQIRSDVTKSLEDLRRDKIIGHSLQAKVHLELPESLFNFVKENDFELDQFFIVSKVDYKKSDTIVLKTEKAEGEKCQRCWIYSIEVGKHSPNDVCERCAKVLKELSK